MYIYNIKSDFAGHISQRLLVMSHIPKSRHNIFFEIIPLQTEFFWHHNMMMTSDGLIDIL